jgi:hypothetical protein
MMLRTCDIPILLSIVCLTAHAQQAEKPLAQRHEEITVLAKDGAAPSTSTSAEGTLDREQVQAVPIFNRSTGFTELLTRTTPGVAADANGFAHPLGEHADTSISLDGQPITDQQAKVFANQVDPAIMQSITATTGSPGAEFGGKTSLTVSVTTRSGLGQKLNGLASSEYGSFGTWAQGLTLGKGGPRWGSFVAMGVNGSGRFLDTPEFQPLHARGNSASIFHRLDWQPNSADALHLNIGGGRSWFQTPNSYDAAAAGQDQRSQIRNLNLALGWNRIHTPWWMTTFTPFVRHDRAQYFPSANAFADATATLAQDRTLTNTGFRLQTLIVKGPHTLKAGGTYAHTLLHERFAVALTDPLYNAVCVDAAGNPVAATTLRDPAMCSAEGLLPNPDFLPGLLPHDLTRGGSLYHFDQSADIAETAFYVQDDIAWRGWLIGAGLRYDIYNGLSRGRQLQPRVGIAYRVPRAGSLLRVSYARLFETPYNENLIFANESTAGGSDNPFGSYRSEPVRPGKRNQFNVGFQQALGSHLSLDADYYWKFTNTAFDFDTLFGTPITFSVAWRKSKIDGLALRLNLADVHGITAYSVMGHVRSRFFTPEVGGLIFNSVPSSPVFRIDHGEEFEQTTQVRYQPKGAVWGKHRPWVAGVWRYNSGLALPDTVPMYTDALKLTADEQSQMGLRCGGDAATPTHAVRMCSASEFSASRIRIPAPGTYDDDRNPVRVTPRTLFDLSAGDDNLWQLEHASVGMHVAVENATGKVALYNFLSTFSGTHFVPPRTLQFGLSIAF